MTPNNKKPRKLLDQASGAGGSAPRLSTAKFSPKSTTTEGRRQNVLEALRAGPKTSHDLRRLGIYQAPARVNELRDKCGHRITTVPVPLVDSDGYCHSRCSLHTSHPGGRDAWRCCMTGATDKDFATLRAQFALRGHELHRTHAPDGRSSYWTTRWGLTKPLADLEAVREFLRQTGGGNDGHSGD